MNEVQTSTSPSMASLGFAGIPIFYDTAHGMDLPSDPVHNHLAGYPVNPQPRQAVPMSISTTFDVVAKPCYVEELSTERDRYWPESQWRDTSPTDPDGVARMRGTEFARKKFPEQNAMNKFIRAFLDSPDYNPDERKSEVVRKLMLRVAAQYPHSDPTEAIITKTLSEKLKSRRKHARRSSLGRGQLSRPATPGAQTSMASIIENSSTSSSLSGKAYPLQMFLENFAEHACNTLSLQPDDPTWNHLPRQNLVVEELMVRRPSRSGSSSGV
ncbi:hypothetical protein PBRA_000284 [Plasmodiophora brassicae]|uniref:Uncharacterized protein n=1 Tax=Plasmodiophora brassicae TaxID=37360 RepID=A0A0G4IH44_PLABS|nr:hypothetical protein PBRA_000284 [Plasmodiophora brassicae]